jgi:hydroxypyruvate isomerase
MPRFSANLSMLYTEVPFLDRFERAARSGFTAVEVQFPYAFDAREIRSRLDDLGLVMVLHNLPAGDWAAGDRGIACQPERSAEFRDGVDRAIDYAQALGVSQLNCLAGISPKGVEQPAIATQHLMLKQMEPCGTAQSPAHDTMVSNLAFAAAALKRHGLRLLIEPVNTFDVPGFFISRTQQAIDLIDECGADNVFVQFDVYHAQRMEGELAATLQRHLARIGHVQIADNPGRHEPGTGEINFAFLFAHLDRIGYAGWVGCEYMPANGTEAGLGWRQMKSLGAAGDTC